MANPKPGKAAWTQGQNTQPLHIVGVREGWLVCRQADGKLCEIIWSDGSYYANLIVDADDYPVKRITKGARVRGTVVLDGGLGAILPNDEGLGAIL